MNLDWLAGKHIVASVSGGKDSAAMSLYLMELGLDFEPVFMDTQWENQATYEWLRGPFTKALGRPIREIGNPLGMRGLIQKKGMFPSRQRRFCTQELKVYPMRDYLSALLDRGVEPVNAVGIRAEESEARARMPEREWMKEYDCEVWRPIIRWTEQEVIDIHRRHGLAPNPLYLAGASRVGCWPCIFSRKAEIRMVADTDPARIDLMVAMEKEVEPLAAARYAEKGETFESLGYHAPTWFQSRLKTDGGTPWPILKVVAWSRTKLRKNDDVEPFDDPMRGCMRWGLCDSAPGPSECELAPVEAPWLEGADTQPASLWELVCAA